LTLLCSAQHDGVAEGRYDAIDTTEVVQNLLLELRRGILALGVLSQLREPQYGYSLLQLLAKKGLSIDQNTLYPLLRRLEQQGLLESNWSVETSRPRRYYVLSAAGQEAVREMSEHWRRLVRVLESLLADGRQADGVD
jgi:PadR family transcriptional regulator PadR